MHNIFLHAQKFGSVLCLTILSNMKVFDKFKQTQTVAVLEIAMGVFFAIMAVRLMSVIFGRSSLGSVFGAEDAENLENLGGRGRTKRQARRGARRETRDINKGIRSKRAASLGAQQGKAGRMSEPEDTGSDEPEEVPSDEEYAEALEMAEHFNSLTQEDIDNMDDAEYAEYVEYAQMVGNAE